MSPINKLKKGIQSGDWNLICEAYRDLTNESLPAPNDANPKILTTKYLISGQELLELMNNHIYEYENIEENADYKTKKTKSVKKPKKNKVVAEVKPSISQDEETQFITDLDEGDPYREISKKVTSTTANKQREYREPFDAHKIKCSKCQQEFLPGKIGKVSIGSGQENKLCENCSKK